MQHTHESSPGFWWFGCFCFENFLSSGKFLFTIRTQGSINFYKTSWVSALWLSHRPLLWASKQYWEEAILMWCFYVISYYSVVILVLMSGFWLHIWTDIEQEPNNHINVFLCINSPSCDTQLIWTAPKFLSWYMLFWYLYKTFHRSINKILIMRRLVWLCSKSHHPLTFKLYDDKHHVPLGLSHILCVLLGVMH